MKRGSDKDTQAQMKQRVSEVVEDKKKPDGNFATTISTGSTLLDLAISGGIKRGGGIPGGILVEIFGSSGSGKTVLLSEIAGAIQRKGGDIMFHDPEARLNKQFASMFDLNTDEIEYTTPDTVTEVFQQVRAWEPKGKKINGILADSLAALSTNLEMDSKDGDKMGMRRAKEFSEELRKTARIITQKNLLMVCSNQVRVNADASPYSEKYTTPGGMGIGFYSSLRLRTKTPTKIKETIKIAGKEVKKVVGIEVEVEVYKSSIWKPYRTAPLVILFDYGIDDIHSNLVFIKQHTNNSTYMVGDENLGVSLTKAIEKVEELDLVKKLKNEVIDLWEIIESKFSSERKKKER